MYKKMLPINTKVQVIPISKEEEIPTYDGIILAENEVGIEMEEKNCGLWIFIPWSNISSISYSERPNNEHFKYPEEEDKE